MGRRCGLAVACPQACTVSVTEFTCVRASVTTLFMLDEMAQMGAMDSLYQAISVIAGYGFVIWGILQNLGQLKNMYPDHQWEAFVQNTAVKQFFGVQDIDTAEYISKMLGKQTITVREKSKNFGKDSNSTNVSLRQTGRDLAMPTEIIGMQKNKMVLLASGVSHPIACEKYVFYKDPEFAGLFDENPMYIAAAVNGGATGEEAPRDALPMPEDGTERGLDDAAPENMEEVVSEVN